VARKQHSAETARHPAGAGNVGRSRDDPLEELARLVGRSLMLDQKLAAEIKGLTAEMNVLAAEMAQVRAQSAETAERGAEDLRNISVDRKLVELALERVTTRSKSAENVDLGVGEELQKILDLLGGHQILGPTVKSELDVHELLHRGLPRGALTSLVEKLNDIPVVDVSEALGVSVRTLQRHKTSPVVLLDVQQSGRAWKFAEILAKATRVLGSQEEAERWLKRSAIGLNQERPIDLLTTPAGVKLVEDYLGRLEYDVYT
jgi:putative toxin-antitoxin system antitoxin component (TIGR02293 family)